MTPWTPLAFVRFVLFFITGILLGIRFSGGIPFYVAACISISLVVSFILLSAALSNKVSKFIAGPLGLFTLIATGYVNVLVSTESADKNHFMYADSVKYYKAIIAGYPEQKAASWKVLAEVTAVKTHQHWRPCTGKVLLYFSKNSFTKEFEYGDALVVKGKPPLVDSPANPHEFDYKQFLSYRNIFHQHFLQQDDVRFLKHDPPSFSMSVAMEVRSWSHNVLGKYVTGTQEQGIASALVLGVTDGLDNDLTSAYAASGAMHVLAVSGLHIGIIYWIILLLLKPLQQSIPGRWMLAFVSIAVLWLYAFVTGLSPSVLRAVTMFSLMSLAVPWGKRTNIYNTLSISAFCLLVYDPYLIMSVGFQLSYLAVIGIVYLYPRIYYLWQPEKLLINKVWQITCVSLAAQIATLPLTLYYFHQFPVYFLFSNLVVIPISFLVLIVGLVLLAASFLDPLARTMGFVLTWIIKALNQSVFITEAFPFSLIDNVYITTPQCFLLMFMIITFTLVFVKRKFVYMVVTIFFAVIFSGMQWHQFIKGLGGRKLTVYNLPGHQGIDLIEGSDAYFFGDSVLLHATSQVGFHIRPNRAATGVKHVHHGDGQPFAKNLGGNRIILWNDSKLLILRKDFNFAPGYRVDYLIVSDNAVRNINQISEKFDFHHLIIDGSNSYYIADKLLKQAAEKRLNVHSVLHQGAYEVNM